MSEHQKVLIIGSGPAGYTAAIYASRAGLSPVLYQGEQPGGQLTITNDVENFPGYAQGVNGQQMMVDLQEQAVRFGTDARYGVVTKVDLESSPKKVLVDGTTEITADTVIISTGASAKWLGLPSEEKFKLGGGVSACAVCDGFFYKGQTVAVVGGGDTACEEAGYLSNICEKVYLIVRRDELRASVIMQNRVKSIKNIEILWNSETEDILGEEEVTGMRVKNNVTGDSADYHLSGFFVAIGHKPNTDVFVNQIDLDPQGYINTAAGTTKTNIEGVYACGDVQDTIYRQAVTAAGTGCMAALDAERFLAEKEV
jgi:thioredoxin reductase (NADPH)